jgi:hypothetical protein
VVSGDVAFSGEPQQYAVALNFFRELERGILALKENAVVKFAVVPGNHDCLLPEAEETVRDALISGLASSMQAHKLDEALLAKVLEPQSHFAEFRKALIHPPSNWNQLCETQLIDFEETQIQLNLYNTALLSRRSEIQGQLRIPVNTLAEQTALHQDATLSISVFHHSYVWLESDVSLAFRSHIERTSDVALTGHQHFQHTFYKANSTGERILYVEGGALQDEKYAPTSAFQLLLFDLNSQEERTILFRWSKDLYKPAEDSDWRSLELNRSIRGDFRFTATFENSLNEIGTPFTHRIKGPLKLRDVFIYPDLMVRTLGTKPKVHEIRGEQIPNYVKTTDRIMFQSPGGTGKTSLCRTIIADLLDSGQVVPILIEGRGVVSSNERATVKSFWEAFQKEYDVTMLDQFKQLPKDKRALIVDDWHRTQLNQDGRKEYLNVAAEYFGKIVLFADDLFQFQELVSKSPGTLLTFDHASLQEFRHALRGKVIDRWISLGRENTVKRQELAREITETERLVSAMIGRNTLPSTPFIILCILQADQEDKVESPEAGSFGYLYEVLVTTALNVSSGRKTQLEKKYVFLARLAYQMFKSNTYMMATSRIRQIAEEYAQSHLIKVDVDALLSDLVRARVLHEIEGNYQFAYGHLFYYFVARYYKDNLNGEQAATLLQEIHNMVDYVSSDRYSTILLFIIYFARDAAGVVKKLIKSADQIYGNDEPATLDSDVAWLNQMCEEEEIKIPEEVNLEENRIKRRALQDRVEKNSDTDPSDRLVRYSDQLSDGEKLKLAFRHIELLGQVLRNFPGSLPGPEKLEILRSTYLLGLRALHSSLNLLATSVDNYQSAVGDLLKAQDKLRKVDLEHLNGLVVELVRLLSRVMAFGTLKRISSSVGLNDLENAYSATLPLVGNSPATRLIDLSVKLDHFHSFPDQEVHEIHDLLAKNPFASNILKDLVLSHIQVFDIDRSLRQSMASLFKVNANAPLLIDPARKKNKKVGKLPQGTRVQAVAHAFGLKLFYLRHAWNFRHRRKTVEIPLSICYCSGILK